MLAAADFVRVSVASQLERAPAIEDYALIGDCHSAALVAKSTAVEWCCFHRFDQRPSFARILDRERGGYLQTRPAAAVSNVRRCYRVGSNVLETRLETPRGTLLVVDAMSVSKAPGGGAMPPMELVRLIACEAGSVDVRAEVMPRFDYGLTVPRITAWAPGLFGAHAGASALEIESDLALSIHGSDRLGGTTTLRAGGRRFVRVRSVAPHDLAPRACGFTEVAARIERATTFWREWSGRCTYEGPYRELVVRSALVLKALTNAPTGAIVAAPTTSLPEVLGGVRNWDYRYTWLRDAGLHLAALFGLGYVEEARAFVAWLARTAAGRAEDLQVVYGAGGERILPEVDLPLDGYAGSRPVRIGNGATTQRQLDVYGHVVGTIHESLEHGGDLSDELWELVSGIVDVVRQRYREPDYGIWEVRSGPEQFVASKVMAWVAVDRAIRVAEATGRAAPLDAWRALRDEIRALVIAQGLSSDGSRFVRTFGSEDSDAALLEVSLSGFLPADDPRILATIDRLSTDLGRGPFLDRYHTADGLPGDEGAFVLAGFWRVIALVRAGRSQQARASFEEIVSRANDVGLFAEEVDPSTGAHLGNFPQAFSHVGLINAALALDPPEDGR